MVALALGQVALVLASRGHPVALPLDDAYIPLQYARTWVEGSPFSYAPGEAVSTGATSPLWLLLLLPAALLPNVIDTLPSAAILLNALAAALAFLLARTLARRHGAGALGSWVAPLAAVLTPFWLFGAFNGMETVLYGALLLAGALVLEGGTAWWLLPLALCRPEGAVLSVFLLVARHVRNRKEPPRFDRPRMIPPGFLISLSVLTAAAATLALPWLLTGAAGASVAAKALWLEPKPEVRGFYLSHLPYFAWRTLWWGLSGARYQPPLDIASVLLRPEAWLNWVWVVFLGGGAVLALVRRRGRALVVLWALTSVGAIAVTAWDAQFYRYLVPSFLLLACGASVGWFGETERRGRMGLGLLGGVLVVTLIAGSLTGPRSLWSSIRVLYRGESERMEASRVLAGDEVARSLPRSARVATHDVGAIGFLGRRPVVDLVGLVTPDLSGAYRHGEGALWEALSRLDVSVRPTHAMVIPAWMPYLARTFWLQPAIWSAGGRIEGPSGQAFQLYPISWPDNDPQRWPYGDFGNTPALHGPGAGYAAWEIPDGVDVADLVSERDHDYRETRRANETLIRDLGFAEDALQGRHAMEGGRDLLETASFTLTGRPDRPARLVARTASARGDTLTVRIGDWTGTLLVPRGEARFAEPSVHVPQEILTAHHGRLAITVSGSSRVFHWWLLQPTHP